MVEARFKVLPAFIWICANCGASPAASVPVVEPAAQPILVEAVRARRVLHFTYDGRERTVEPHAYGVTAERGAVLHGYQTGGGSVTGGLPGWRTFAVGGVADLRVGPETFAGPRPDHVEGRPRLDPLWAEAKADVPTAR